MSQKRLSRNAPCPCGSGLKYKRCCYDKGYEFLEDDAGIVRRVPMSKDVADSLESHFKDLENHYGRPLKDDDELFPEMQLEHIEHQMCEAMRAAGIDSAIIHAFETTGLLISEENEHLISDIDRRRWDEAIADYRRKH